MKNCCIFKINVFPVVSFPVDYLIYLLLPCDFSKNPDSLLLCCYKCDMLAVFDLQPSCLAVMSEPFRKINIWQLLLAHHSRAPSVLTQLPDEQREAGDGNNIQQRGECMQASPFNHACVREATRWRRAEGIENKFTRWKAQSSLRRVVVVLEHRRPFMAVCAVPACTGAQQHVELLLMMMMMGEEEVVISHWWRFSMSIFTPVCCCWASLITNSSRWHTSVIGSAVLMTKYLNFPIILSCGGS